MLGGGVCNDVVDHIEYWVPDIHKNEYGYQEELQEYLDARLNESGNQNMHVGLGGGGGGHHEVKREHGKSQADVAVDDEVGIEMKHQLTNGDIDTLRGQIEKYKKEFPCVIAVACGIEDIDGWRGLQNEYEEPGTVGMQMDASEVHLIHKKQEHFGKEPSDVRESGGGGLF